MATKDKKSASKKASTQTNVTRIKASDDKPEKAVTRGGAASASSEREVGTDRVSEHADKTRKNPLRAIGGYFAGSWYELKQVRWPNRKATWSLTGAMLVFSAFFVVFILLLDALFKFLFEKVLG